MKYSACTIFKVLNWYRVGGKMKIRSFGAYSKENNSNNDLY